MNMAYPRNAILALGMGMLLFAACGTTRSSNFYLLSPMDAPEGGRETREDGLSVGVGPVDLPAYLDRPQLVVRTSRNELRFAEFDRWAEPVIDNFHRVLMENLSLLLATNRIFRVPARVSVPGDYRVAVEVTCFEGGADGKVALDARWMVFAAGHSTPVTVQTSSIRKSATGGENYTSQAAALSEALAELSREIAEALQSVAEQAREQGETAE